MNKQLVITIFAFLIISSLLEESECQRGLGGLIGRVVGRGKGPSGLPKQHFPHSGSRKEAMDRAQNAGKGNKPVEHQAHGPGQTKHFHPTNKDGSIKKDGSHYDYGKKKGN